MFFFTVGHGSRAQDAIMSIFTCIAICLFVIAFAVQDWGAPPGPSTIGPHDSTWGTWLTCYVKFVELSLMAWAAPGQGFPKTMLFVGLLLNGIVYLIAGVMFQFYPEAGPQHSVLWAAWCMCQIAAGSFCVFAGYSFVRLQGKLQSKPSPEVVGIVLLVWTALTEMLGLFFVLRKVPVLISLVSTVNATLTLLALAVLGCVGGAREWSVGALVAFLVAGVLQFVPVAMLKSSQSFNNDGLAHNQMILYYVSFFGLLCQLQQGDFKQLAGASCEPALVRASIGP
mmetsp:Transcript_4400/g.11986  ORF Transcript_4400/g.11986 Transcript_4400/m.11986 type:complete len:283 (+) Transcript_4400:101-949(+)